MTDILKYAVQGCQWTCEEVAKACTGHNDTAAPSVRDVSYNFKALIFNANTLSIVTVLALQILGIGNPFLTLFVVGIGLLGREIAKQAMMNFVERGAYSIFSSHLIPPPYPDRTLTAGNVVLLYDFTP